MHPTQQLSKPLDARLLLAASATSLAMLMSSPVFGQDSESASTSEDESDIIESQQPESDQDEMDVDDDEMGDDEDMFDFDLDALLNTKLTATNPVGINHTHVKGEWMISYGYMHMEMDGNRNGTSGVSTADVLANFMIAPLSMTMDMNMAMVMYAPTDKLTLMFMAPQINKSMDLITGGGTRFTTKSSGIGDIQLTSLIGLYEEGMNQIHITLGASLPTGSIDKTDSTPAGVSILPYPMQLGSGTYDLITGATYIGEKDNWTWGADVEGLIRIGKNDRDYRLGNEFTGTVFTTYKVTDRLTLTLKSNAKTWGNISGADPALNPAMVPTANPNLRGGTRFDIVGGVNFYQHEGFFEGHRLAVEIGLPYYQDLDGPQLETDWIFSFEWSWVF
jgi:Putative MetA-pathway of phenol degradation